MDISYKYDGFNQLKSAVNQTTTTYSYNGDGIRISKNVGGVVTTHMLDGGNVVADISGKITKYVRVINLICREKSGEKYYYLYNGHGDVVQITNSIGSIVNNYKYDEWGNILNQTEGINNPFKYCGEYFDKEIGLYYLRVRYYDPTIGRFINEDSFLGNDKDPLSLNLYTYTHNNPINLFDPSGHDAKDMEGGGPGGGGPGMGQAVILIAEKVAEKRKEIINGITTTIYAAGDKVADAAKGIGNLIAEVMFDDENSGDEESVDEDSEEVGKPTVPENRLELDKELTNKGFTCKGTTDGGYVEYKHPDGTTVWVRPDGEIITIRKEWLPDGSKKVPVRYYWDGTPVPVDESAQIGHNTEEFVEGIDKATYLPPKKTN